MVLHKLKILGIPNKANYRLNNARVRYNSISSDEISFPIPKNDYNIDYTDMSMS